MTFKIDPSLYFFKVTRYFLLVLLLATWGIIFQIYYLKVVSWAGILLMLFPVALFMYGFCFLLPYRLTIDTQGIRTYARGHLSWFTFQVTWAQINHLALPNPMRMLPHESFALFRTRHQISIVARPEPAVTRYYALNVRNWVKEEQTQTLQTPTEAIEAFCPETLKADIQHPHHSLSYFNDYRLALKNISSWMINLGLFFLILLTVVGFYPPLVQISLLQKGFWDHALTHTIIFSCIFIALLVKQKQWNLASSIIAILFAFICGLLPSMLNKVSILIAHESPETMVFTVYSLEDRVEFQAQDQLGVVEFSRSSLPNLAEGTFYSLPVYRGWFNVKGIQRHEWRTWFLNSQEEGLL